MIYLIRHGQDDETVRGGWSNAPLTELGIQQAEELAKKLDELNIRRIYSSDLRRSMQTAEILGIYLNIKVEPIPDFREVNNGDLAGMKNDEALIRYPGLFWNQLKWEERYPGGESPKEFFERISGAWDNFSKDQTEAVVLVTHGGVINVISAILQNKQYNNREKHKKISYTQMITLYQENGVWNERYDGGRNI